MSYSKYNWQELYEEFKTKNVSPGAFAKEKGLPPSCAYAHFKKLGYTPDPVKSKSGQIKKVKDFEKIDLVPVKVLDQQAPQKSLASDFLDVIIGKSTIRLYKDFDRELLKQTVEVLKELCLE